jgi:hypothetical protein
LLGLVRNPATPDDVLLRLARNEAAAEAMSYRRRDLPDPVIQEILARHDPESLIRFTDVGVSPRMLAMIAADPDPALRSARANLIRDLRPGTCRSIEDLEQVYGKTRSMLARDPDPAVRAAVADLWWERPADVHAALITDPEPAVRANATRRPEPPVPQELQAACLDDPITRAQVASHATLSDERAMALVRDPGDKVRQAVATNPGLPAGAVAMLVADPDRSCAPT